MHADRRLSAVHSFHQSVRDNIRANPVIGEDLAENAGISMVQRAHGIEGMRRVSRTGLHGGLCDRQLSIGVSDADANILPRSRGRPRFIN